MQLKEMCTALTKKLELKPKKILIVGPAWPLRGGLATYNERLCREFISQGFECEIQSFSLQYPGFLFPGKTQYSDDPKPTDIVIHGTLNSINPFNWFKTANRIKKAGYDLLIFRYWMSFMSPVFGTLARIIKTPNNKIIAITDNVFSHERKPFEKTLAQYFLNSCDGYLSMSKDVLGQVQHLQANKPCVYMPHPMYDMFGPVIEKAEAIQKLGLDPEYKYCLFFGFIRKYKGLHLLLESFAKLDRQALKLKLIVAGEFYEDAAPYHQQIHELQLTEDVILKSDFIPNNQVGLYFCASDIVVQTYITATQSGVTQIAYFYNTPMLVTNVGGLAELVPNNVVGMVCEKNSDEISARLEQYFQNNSEAQMKLAIEQEKQKFTWPYLCNALLQIAAKN